MDLEQSPKHYASGHGGNSALELFNLPPTDTSVLSARWQPYHPESRIQRGSPIEFNIETTNNDSKQGQRWIVMYFPEKTKTEYFDSYGLSHAYYRGAFTKYCGDSF